MIQPTIKTSDDIRNLRKRLGMSQKVFCSTYGLNLQTYQGWEQSKRGPNQVTLILLSFIDKNPAWVAAILKEIAQERGFANFGEMNARSKALQNQAICPPV